MALLRFCGKGLNKLFPALGEFTLEKAELSHSGHHIHWAGELQVAKEKTRPNQPGTARYQVLGPGAVTERIYFFFLLIPTTPHPPPLRADLYAKRWWGIVNAVELVN